MTKKNDCSHYVPILVALVLAALLLWFRRGGGGEVGRRVRNSDHWALEDAIHEKQEELEELQKQFHKVHRCDRFFAQMDIQDCERELSDLVALRDKYPLEPKS